MSIIALRLTKRTVLISVKNAVYAQKISYHATFPEYQTLTTADGIAVCEGYVEFLCESPIYETETLHFIGEISDPDGGKKLPPSISFYALLPQNLFIRLRDMESDLSIELRLSIHQMNPMKYGDSMGEHTIWDTELGNPVKVDSYEIVIASPSRNT